MEKEDRELLETGKEIARTCDLLEEICKEQEEILKEIFGDLKKRTIELGDYKYKKQF